MIGNEMIRMRNHLSTISCISQIVLKSISPSNLIIDQYNMDYLTFPNSNISSQSFSIYGSYFPTEKDNADCKITVTNSNDIGLGSIYNCTIFSENEISVYINFQLKNTYNISVSFYNFSIIALNSLSVNTQYRASLIDFYPKVLINHQKITFTGNNINDGQIYTIYFNYSENSNYRLLSRASSTILNYNNLSSSIYLSNKELFFCVYDNFYKNIELNKIFCSKIISGLFITVNSFNPKYIEVMNPLNIKLVISSQDLTFIVGKVIYINCVFNQNNLSYVSSDFLTCSNNNMCSCSIPKFNLDGNYYISLKSLSDDYFQINIGLLIVYSRPTFSFSQSYFIRGSMTKFSLKANNIINASNSTCLFTTDINNYFKKITYISNNTINCDLPDFINQEEKYSLFFILDSEDLNTKYTILSQISIFNRPIINKQRIILITDLSFFNFTINGYYFYSNVNYTIQFYNNDKRNHLIISCEFINKISINCFLNKLLDININLYQTNLLVDYINYPELNNLDIIKSYKIPIITDFNPKFVTSNGNIKLYLSFDDNDYVQNLISTNQILIYFTNNLSSQLFWVNNTYYCIIPNNLNSVLNIINTLNQIPIFAFIKSK